MMEAKVEGLRQGPLPKSIYTYELEVLTRRLLQNEDFKIFRRNGESYIQFEDGTHFNLDKIIKHADFTHLSLKTEDFQGYDNYHQKHSKEKSSIRNPHSLQKRYPELSIAEMNAINIYTNPSYYSEMNALLRGTYPFDEKKNRKISDVIIHSVFCASALSKIPDQKVETVYRVETIYDKDLHQQRIDAATKKDDTKGVMKLTGFVSTSTAEKSEFTGNVRFEFTDLVGKYIAPFSKFPKEKEFLIPPTQIQITGHRSTIHPKTKYETHVFSASTVRDLDSVDKESLVQKRTITEDTRVVLVEMQEHLTEQMKNIKKVTLNSLGFPLKKQQKN